MKILIIGNGGREHALAWKISQSPQVTRTFVAPGNAGTAQESDITNVAINVDDLESLATFAQDNQIDLTLVGPEIPLSLGIVDHFQARHLPIFGPTQTAAQLESSKVFCKAFLMRHKIPTASYEIFTDPDAAKRHIKQETLPLAIKADGLAAGKGVILVFTEEEAFNAVDTLLGEQLDQTGRQIVVESFLSGEEASFIVMSDGKNILPLATSQDHKARFDNDQGPNTGGMGAYSPAPVVTSEIHKKVMETVIEPTIKGMAEEGHPFTGFLYAGLMIDEQGNINVLEYNCRFGDPETQPIMMRLDSDLAELCLAAVQQRLDKVTPKWNPQTALGVVMVSKDYPGPYSKGDIITGLDKFTNTTDVKIFHAGTKMQDSHVVTNGGRVLCVTALGDTVKQAQEKAYQTIEVIHFDDADYRHDIGYRAIEREL